MQAATSAAKMTARKNLYVPTKTIMGRSHHKKKNWKNERVKQNDPDHENAKKWNILKSELKRKVKFDMNKSFFVLNKDAEDIEELCNDIQTIFCEHLQEFRELDSKTNTARNKNFKKSRGQKGKRSQKKRKNKKSRDQ
eukprot:jgi/Bigna1/129916/aug1.10_g4624